MRQLTIHMLIWIFHTGLSPIVRRPKHVGYMLLTFDCQSCLQFLFTLCTRNLSYVNVGVMDNGKVYHGHFFN